MTQNFRGLFLTVLKLSEFHIKQGLITAAAFSISLKKRKGGVKLPHYRLGQALRAPGG